MIEVIDNNKITEFLEANGISRLSIEPIKQDASNRRYFRINNKKNTLLMDSPLIDNNNYEFIKISEHLDTIGLSAPKIINKDYINGLFLIEDFGNLTFNEAIKNNISEELLYKNAVQCLSKIHKSDHPKNIPIYNNKYLLAELSLFTEWFFKEIDVELNNSAIIKWEKVWDKALIEINKGNNKLVLRDFHADNLFWLPNRENIKRIGLIDFQDALIGHEAYDISSLLEDVRRNVSAKTKEIVMQEFIKINNIENEKQFYQNYKVLTAQRNAKIVGIFIRLARRDNKKNYLELVNKAMNIFLSSAKDANLEEVLQWIEYYIPKHKLYLP
jgi:aminoglycoside/choline kinase family phosphotransferase